MGLERGKEMQYPMFLSKRLTIRPFQLDDAPKVQELAGDKEVAKTTTIIPHPYPDGWAEEWITSTYKAMDKGYCTEAGKVIVKYAFEELSLNRIYADAFTKNPASSKVMQKLGLKHEGTFKQSCLYWGVYEDTVVYGLTKSDYYKG